MAHNLLKPKNQYRPRWWVRIFWNSWKHRRGKGAVIRPRTRLDVMPYHEFYVGADSLIEDYSTINNAVGDVIIGDRSLIGLGNTIIGPVIIGNDVMLAQNVGVSGLNHGYEDVDVPISRQQCTTATIVIEDESWIGANTVITSGIHIGKHAVVAAGSVVTKDIPPYTVVAGNPARMIKQFNFKTGAWEKVESATGNRQPVSG